MKSIYNISIIILFAATLEVVAILFVVFFQAPPVPSTPYSTLESLASVAATQSASSAAPTTASKAETAESISPKEASEAQLESDVQVFLSAMSEREKLCQLMMVSTDVLTGVPSTTVAGEGTRAALEQYPVGGLVFFAG